MSESARATGAGLSAASIDEATVVSADGLRAVVRSSAFGTGEARSTVGALRAGDVVLIASASNGRRYVIGTIRSLRAADGTSAALERDDDGSELLRVRDPRGEIVFEHRPEEGRSVLRVPAGALDIVADAGDLALRAAGRVIVEGKEGVVNESAGPVVLRSSSGGASSELRLEADRAHLETGTFAAKAARADAIIGDVNLVAATVRTVAHRVRQKAEDIELRVGRLVERAKDSYREVEGLSQTRAGRLRLVAERALHLLGESAELQATEDVKIKGEKIYLG